MCTPPQPPSPLTYIQRPIFFMFIWVVLGSSIAEKLVRFKVSCPIFCGFPEIRSSIFSKFAWSSCLEGCTLPPPGAVSACVSQQVQFVIGTRTFSQNSPSVTLALLLRMGRNNQSLEWRVLFSLFSPEVHYCNKF